MREEPERLSINDALQRLSKRAERLTSDDQSRTFVKVGGIESALASRDHRVIFGRRGTGKTHLLSHVAERARDRKGIGVLIDLRTMGSGTYVYAAVDSKAQDRATRLLRDFVAALHDNLYDAVTAPGTSFSPNLVSEELDTLAASVREIVVSPTIKESSAIEASAHRSLSAATELRASLRSSPNLDASVAGSFGTENRNSDRLQIERSGIARLSVSVGDCHGAIQSFARKLNRDIYIYC